jgi:hypothetical protein
MGKGVSGVKEGGRAVADPADRLWDFMSNEEVPAHQCYGPLHEK